MRRGGLACLGAVRGAARSVGVGAEAELGARVSTCTGRSDRVTTGRHRPGAVP